MAWNPFKKSSWKKLGNKLDPKKNGVSKKFDKAFNPKKNGVKKTFDKVGDELDPKNVERQLKKVGQKIIDEIANAILKEGLKKTHSAVSSAKREMDKLKKKKPKLVDAIDGLGYTLQIGPIHMSYNSFYTKATGIQRALSDLTKKKLRLRRRTILDIVDALAPDSINIGLDIDLAALVVSSDAVSVGFSLDSISTDLFLEIGDIILEKIGVPE